MTTLDHLLADAVRRGPAHYYNEILRATRPIHERLSSPEILSGILHCKKISEARELLPVALILNDCTSIEYFGGSSLKISIPEARLYTEMFGTDNVRFNLSPEVLAEAKIDRANPSFAPCFAYADGAEQAPLMRSLLPFIERGNVIFQPSRGVMAREKVDDEGHTHWHMLDVDRSSPLDVWEPVTDNAMRPTPIEMSRVTGIDPTLFQITLPFLKGVPFRELNAVLVDETDLVASFRSALKATVRQATKDGLTAREMVNDLIRPKVSALERKLKSVQRIHRIKVGGAALGSVALALTSASTGGVGAGLLAIASAGGFGLLTKEYSDFVAKREEVEQDPFYLLWRCQRAKPVHTRAKS